MAFSLTTEGTRLNLRTGNCIPKKPSAAYLAAVPNATPSTYSSGPPAHGQLTKNNTTGNGLLDQCVLNDVPAGFVFHANSNNGLISQFEFRTCEVQLEYAGTPTVGQQIQANGTPGVIPIGGILYDQVKGVNSGGVGLIVSKDEVAGLCTVRFA